jgi:hypothetical protein
MVKRLVVRIDRSMACELERVAPARSRERSAFVRAALRRALDEIYETSTTAAYKAQPDSEPARFDPRLWEPATLRSAARRKHR